MTYNQIRMRFNINRLKAVARPIAEKDMAQIEYRDANRDWLVLSEKIALETRHILRTRNITQTQLASMMNVSPSQITKILSGKENLSLRTIAKMESALGQSLISIGNSSDRATHTPKISTPSYARSEEIYTSPLHMRVYASFTSTHNLV